MITQDKLKKILSLDESTGVFTNKVNRGRYKKGDVAGYNIDGYTYICLDRKSYPAHHLVWLWNTGSLPPKGFDMDHINMDRRDNRFSNLRLATRSQNMFNTQAHQDSRSNSKNVFFRKDTGKWSVRVTVEGVYKSFGSYEDKELADLVASEVRHKYHGEFTYA